jgi:hypothetical protein
MKLKLIRLIIFCTVPGSVLFGQPINYTDLNSATAFHGRWEGKLSCKSYAAEAELNLVIKKYKNTADSVKIILDKPNPAVSYFDSLVSPVDNGVIRININPKAITGNDACHNGMILMLSLLDSNIISGVYERTGFMDCAAIEYYATKAKQTQGFENARAWLQNNIEACFNAKTVKMEDICTKRYVAFKNDGWSLSEGDITKQQFATKWSKIYNLKKICSDCGFLIHGQDNGKISATVNFKSKTADGFWFTVLINDRDLKAVYKNDIRLVKKGSSYLIDEVLEYL